MIEVCLARLDLDGCSEALNGLVEVTSTIQANALIVVCVGVFWVNLDRSRVVLDSQAELTQFVIGESTVEQCLKVVRVDLERLRVQGDGCLVVALLARCVALRVELLSLRLELGVDLHLLGTDGGLLDGRARHDDLLLRLDRFARDKGGSIGVTVRLLL